MDEDLEQLTREELVAWIRKLRAGIRHLSPCLSEEGWLSRTLHAFQAVRLCPSEGQPEVMPPGLVARNAYAYLVSA